ncbi:phytochrome-like protein [Lentinula edodes]|uniref:Phytochrome-like protein n=1 Tax=Lentinula edodes TaxID=5353 RepID=A0A1Q3DY29_LENED|nr:phytochrome-like protein [Lentinula edodes]
MTNGSSSSFVYPIKSLLGNIQPASDDHNSLPFHPTARNVTTDIGSKTPLSGTQTSNVIVTGSKKRRTKRSKQAIATYDDLVDSQEQSKQAKRHSDNVPNFSHFPAGEDHIQDAHGHHIVTGREGKLTRCEDEPIRAPGAVQGFGVLIVLEEEGEALVVRQVSENASELLGLPPRYLFKLECFTDVLPESQASLLWDNIQFLSESANSTNTTRDEELERDSPDIFLLSGYGAPGTAISSLPVSVDPYDPWGVHINEQLGDAPDLDTFLKVTVGVIKDLTQFHRVLVYQFDEVWNGQVVAELVDWSMTHDLYKGLHFPAGDIPAQARELYKINKVRILYDRDQPTARIVVRDKEDLEQPLNMTHCYLRAMSPLHVKYLGNMGVRASMSVSIMAFGSLWGLVACHSYGTHGMRVSFPVRQMLRLLSQSISRNIERLSYAQRLHTRKLINTIPSENHPTGYIVSNADDLLGLFDADYGILVIGDGAKILGPNQHGQEILIMAEYLRLKQFDTIQVSQAVTKDFPDLNLSTGLEVIAGLLCVPLSSGGKDFIAFLRKGQPRDVHWAGKPYKADNSATASLEPRKSFRIWSETVAGRCRAWTDEQLETAGVLALVYGKFIEVWRQKESALQTTKLTNLLLSNASHEVRTPLNHIINYLEMALNGPLDFETRDNLSRSHAASKNLLFTINDLLDLTRLESGNEMSNNEPFNLAENIQDAISIYRSEANRRHINFEVDVDQCPSFVIGDRKKIRTVVQNLTANALKYTMEGKIAVRCVPFGEPEGLREPTSTAMEIVVADTGCGIPPTKLESIFREIEQVESSEPKTSAEPGVGLGLAVVARIVEQLGGQLRVESKVGEGSQFSFLLPLSLMVPSETSTSPAHSRSNSSLGSLQAKSTSEVDFIVEALANSSQRSSSAHSIDESRSPRKTTTGLFPVADSQYPVRPIKVPEIDTQTPLTHQTSQPSPKSSNPAIQPPLNSTSETKPIEYKSLPLLTSKAEKLSLRVLIVEDNDINRLLLAKRLRMDGHVVVNTTNGQEGLDKVMSDRNFDCVLMDINMPILNGLEASERIREFEKAFPSSDVQRLSLKLNGRIPIFAVSASLYEHQRSKLSDAGMDGWILKPIDFKRLATILKGVTDLAQRERDRYTPGGNWEVGGWLAMSPTPSDAPIEGLPRPA